MKKIFNILAVTFFLFFICNFSSCKKHGNSPVDQYVEIIDEAADKAEKIASMQDLINVQEIISPEAAKEIARENADYELTESDKSKLKKSFDRLLRVAYNKTAEYGGFPEEIKKQSKDQAELIIEAANKGIDNAKTLGDLNGIR